MKDHNPEPALNFASDNGGPVPQQVLEALARANDSYVPSYGADDLSQEVCDGLRRLFEAPDAAVFLTATGTAANVLALSTLSLPYQTIFCSELAHIHTDECNAPEFYTGGAKLTLVPEGAVMRPDALRAAIEGEENRGVHGPDRGAVSITNVAEDGTVYSLEALTALCDVARAYGLPVHLDGARFANACVRLGCTPAEMTWKAGVDVAVFGGTKNGLMGAEAVLFFDQAKARGFEHRRKRGAHLFSKHRYLAAQMQAYLQDDLWRDLAARANARADRLRAGLEALGVEMQNATHGNMLFARLPRHAQKELLRQGAIFHPWGDMSGPEDGLIPARLVCDWSMTEAAVDRFVAMTGAVLSGAARTG